LTERRGRGRVNGDEMIDAHNPLAVIAKGGRQEHQEQAWNNDRSHAAIVRPGEFKRKPPRRMVRRLLCDLLFVLAAIVALLLAAWLLLLAARRRITLRAALRNSVLRRPGNRALGWLRPGLFVR